MLVMLENTAILVKKAAHTKSLKAQAKNCKQQFFALIVNSQQSTSSE
jgi:hypothetical protein